MSYICGIPKLYKLDPPPIRNTSIEFLDGPHDFMDTAKAKKWNSKIGQLIQKKRLTPIQTGQLISLVLTGIFSSASLSLENTLSQTHFKIKAFTSLLSGVFFASTLYFFRLTDMQTVKGRQKLVNQLSQQTFSQIFRGYGIDSIIGYALLSDPKIQSLPNPWAELILYKKLRQLGKEFKRVEAEIEEHRSRIQEIYRRGIACLTKKNAYPKLPAYEKPSVTDWDFWLYHSNERVNRAYAISVAKLNKTFQRQKKAIENYSKL